MDFNWSFQAVSQIRGQSPTSRRGSIKEASTGSRGSWHNYIITLGTSASSASNGLSSSKEGFYCTRNVPAGEVCRLFVKALHLGTMVWQLEPQKLASRDSTSGSQIHQQEPYREKLATGSCCSIQPSLKH